MEILYRFISKILNCTQSDLAPETQLARFETDKIGFNKYLQKIDNTI